MKLHLGRVALPLAAIALVAACTSSSGPSPAVTASADCVTHITREDVTPAPYKGDSPNLYGANVDWTISCNEDLECGANVTGLTGAAAQYNGQFYMPGMFADDCVGSFAVGKPGGRFSVTVGYRRPASREPLRHTVTLDCPPTGGNCN